jgi:peroxiredoxin
VSKALLNVLILIAGMVVGVLQYKLKPPLNEKEVGEYAQQMISNTEWKGHIAPDFEIKTTRGDLFQLSDNVGKKIIVLNFFATWCEPCRQEMPELNRYFAEHSGDSFLLVGIDADEKQDPVDRFIKDLKVEFPVGIDNGTIQKQYGVTGYPTTVLIGVDGKVQFYEPGGLVNAEVAFDPLVRQNRQHIDAGEVISAEDFRLQSQKENALPVRGAQEATAGSDDPQNKLDERGRRIVAQMDCPCGCDQKVQTCTCNTSSKIKKALATEDFGKLSDDEITRQLNKRFCTGGM